LVDKKQQTGAVIFGACGDCATCTVYIHKNALTWDWTQVARMLVHEFIHACSCASHRTLEGAYDESKDFLVQLYTLCPGMAPSW
jgi:hypothetical protein